MSEFTNWSGELYHHGIRGMKWGVRRYQNPDGSLTEAGKRRYGDLDNYKRLTDKRKPKYLSDSELRSRIARLNLEKQYKDLKRSDTSSLLNKLSDYKDKSEQRKAAKEERDIKKLELETRKTEARAQAFKAREERREKKQERKLWETEAKTKEQRTSYLAAKNQRSDKTVRGGIAKWLNRHLSKDHKMALTRRGEEISKRKLNIAQNNMKIKELQEYNSMSVEELEKRIEARAQRRRKHTKA